MLTEMLKERGVCEIDSFDAEAWPAVRKKYVDILCNEEYGLPLPEPTSLTFEVPAPEKINRRFCAGEASKYEVIAHAEINGKSFSFPFTAVIPNKKGPFPFIIHNDFEYLVPSKYLPVEEMVNNGFAVFELCYQNVTSDNDDYTNGLSGLVYPDGVRKNANDPGKIMMWAWANMRVMDYAMQHPLLDHNHGAIAGHSRLGKTSLVTGMLDKRFQYVISNDSGCSGTAITRGKVGEQISHITSRFPYWFCENYKKYVDHNDLTFDQHMLLATVAPRTVLIGSAVEDTWADPDSEYLSCVAASSAWENLGETGFVAPDRLPVPGADFHQGNICYHLRDGLHYFSRRDWLVYMNIIRKKARYS